MGVAISELEARNRQLTEGITCAVNALTDSMLCSGNDVETNMHFVRKLKALLPPNPEPEEKE